MEFASQQGVEEVIRGKGGNTANFDYDLTVIAAIFAQGRDQARDTDSLATAI